MRVKEPPIQPPPTGSGTTRAVNGHTLTVDTSESFGMARTNVTLTFGSEPTSFEAARINAALKPYGVRVAKYAHTGAMAVKLPGQRRRRNIVPGSPLVARVYNVAANEAAAAGIAAAAEVRAAPALSIREAELAASKDARDEQRKAFAAALAGGLIRDPLAFDPFDETGSLKDVSGRMGRASIDHDEPIGPELPPPYVMTVDDLPAGYVPPVELTEVWNAVKAIADTGKYPPAMMFLGPSGCGKTRAGQYLAESEGLPFTKVDAAAMVDPESWFGTREIRSEDGVSITDYHPSTFAVAIQQPGVVLVDEVNRAKDEDRNIMLPLLDATGVVTNPLTGEKVTRHPKCFIILSGNRGLQFTGTFAVDPALMTRSLVVEFGYLDAITESLVAQRDTGIDRETADLFARLAFDTRVRAADPDSDMLPVSTREVLTACDLVKAGLSVQTAFTVAILNGTSAEGGESSERTHLLAIWTGIVDPDSVPAKVWPDPCQKHHTSLASHVAGHADCGKP